MASSSIGAPGIHLGKPPSEKLTLPATRGAWLVYLLEGIDFAPPKTLTISARDKEKESKVIPNP
jgi:hypothetical protein